jgi:hypothetical protein
VEDNHFEVASLIGVALPIEDLDPLHLGLVGQEMTHHLEVSLIVKD